MTSDVPLPREGDRRITPADLHHLVLPRGTMMHPGYAEPDVERLLARVAQEIARLTAEKAELRDQVHALQDQMAGIRYPEPPSDQAVRILATAQQTADDYVAEAEEFSRQLSRDARTQYEEQLREARESAGAIIQAAHEAAGRLGGSGAALGTGPSTEELEEQVAYLRAFGQATRTQLRAYLEALLRDVESEWGRAHPNGVPDAPLRTPSQRGGADAPAAAFHGNTAGHAGEGAGDDQQAVLASEQRG